MTTGRAFVTVLATLLFGAPVPKAHACGSYDPTLFVSPYAPDTPLDRFAAGELGVLEPTWARAYLVASYRYLAGIPLGPGEQAAAVAYWKGKEPGSPGGDLWTAARAAATSPRLGSERREKPVNVYPERRIGYSSYVNCGDDAFQRAARTLRGYVDRYGEESSETRSWLAAQDTVFTNCSGEKAAFPEPLPASAPAPLRADRAYQIASASFYAGRLEEARKSFEEIANDASSPWREIAPYLAARAVLRQATLGADEGAAGLRFFAEARARFRAVRDGAKTPELRRWSEDLLRLVELRLDASSDVSAASARVLKPQAEDEFAVSFVHYRDLLFKVLGWGGEVRPSYEPDPSDDLTRWILAFQADGAPGLDRALEGWTRTRKNTWLAAAVAKISPDHPRCAEIAEAVRRLPRNAPGSVHLTYHLARLLTEAGRKAEARALVDASLPAAEGAGTSAKNLFLELKVRNAATFEEFAAAAPRRAVEGEMAGGGDVFDDYTRDVLNRRLPLDALARFAEKAQLEPKAAAKMRRMVLTRAILLGRTDVARALAPPGVKVRWDASDWRVDAALAILVEDSESRPYALLDSSYAIAWWCTLPGPLANGHEPAFLSTDERSAVADETLRLESVGAAATWFTREALAFARARPEDPRAPEFLARAVRTTREGCGDGETRALSKAAFDHLHRRYPKSPFTAQTKYWFEGRGWSPPPPTPAAPPS